MASLPELRGKTLACWCTPKPCHADVLSRLANSIFVFGSNLAGRHGAGSALEAVRNHGAIYGQGVGLQGRSYAIPTKDGYLRTLPVEKITGYVSAFVDFAHENTYLIFNVVKVGCGLAGLSENVMRMMFHNAPENCNLPEGWR
jgi:hypothetical protein